MTTREDKIDELIAEGTRLDDSYSKKDDEFKEIRKAKLVNLVQTEVSVGDTEALARLKEELVLIDDEEAKIEQELYEISVKVQANNKLLHGYIYK